jgi:hypothetical protein
MPSQTQFTNAIGYAKFFSRSHDAVIRVYDETGNVVETLEHAGDFKEPKHIRTVDRCCPRPLLRIALESFLIGYAKLFSRSHDAVIRVYDEAGNVIETHEHVGDFKEW